MTLSKVLISPSILNEIFASYSSCGCRFFSFNTLNISCHPLLACRVSAETSAVSGVGFPLWVTCCFSLASFNIIYLCLVSASLINMHLDVFLFCFILYGTLVFFDLIDYFLSYLGEVFNYNHFTNFLTTSFSLLPLASQ